MINKSMPKKSTPTNTTLPKDTGHSEMGPSGAPVWLNCTGSVFLAREAPPETHTADADRGNDLHDWGARRLLSRINWAIEGSLYPHRDDFYDASIDERSRDIVENYVHHCYNDVAGGSMTGKVYGVEQKLHLESPYDLYGTSDFFVVFKDNKAKLAASITDLKGGFKDRDPHKDPQLGYYAIMLRELLRKHGKKLDYVMASFFQPALGFDQYPAYKWTNKALDALENKIKKTVEDLYTNKKPTFKTGEHCDHCRVRATCPSYAKHIEKETGLTLIGKSKFELPAIEALPDETIAAIALYGSSLSDLARQANRYIIDRHNSGEPLKEVKIVRARSNRKIADPAQAIRTLFQLGYTSDDIFKKSLKGIGDLSSLAGYDVIDKMTERPPGSLKVVALDDPGEPVLSPMEILEGKKDGS